MTPHSTTGFPDHEAMRSREQDWRRVFDRTDAVPFPRTWWTIHIWQGMLRIAYRVLLKVSIEGRGNIPSSPVIFVANHQSTLDPFLVTTFLTNSQFRTTYYLAKEFRRHLVVKRWLVDRHNVILVRKSEPVSSVLRKLAYCLRRRGNILIFPEGTRSADGTLTDFKKSFALLSCAFGVPVVPVIIGGTREALPKGRFFLKFRAPVSARFLDAVRPDGHTPASLTAAVHAIMRAEMETHRSITTLDSGT